MTDLLSQILSRKITFGSEQEAERDVEIAGLVMASSEELREFCWSAKRKNGGVGREEASPAPNMGGGERLEGIYGPGLTEKIVFTTQSAH